MTQSLTILDRLPAGLLDCPAGALYTMLEGPTLIHLPGKQGQPLFSVVLQHGNETVGWEAARSVLQDYNGSELPRPWSIFIANVDAARYGIRQLKGQPDFNRCWPGGVEGGTPTHRILSQVTEQMRKRLPFASVDVHNNTGMNPHYGAVNKIRNDNLQLAALFSRTVLYFTTPRGVQSGAFAEFCPAVTVECGQVGAEDGVKHAGQFLDACLHLHELPDTPVPAGDLRLYHTIARVGILDGLSFGFNDSRAEVNLAEDLDTLNFTPLPRGTRLARVALGAGYGVVAHDEHGDDVTERYFHLRGGELRIREPVMPSMLTRNETVIRQDCLCYLMEEMSSLPQRL